MKILIADPSSTNRTIIKRGLEGSGALEVEALHEATCSMDVIPLVRKEPIDLLILSTALSDLSLEDLLSSLSLSSANLIIIADKPQRVTLPAGIKLLGYLVKPFSIANIQTKLAPLTKQLKPKEPEVKADSGEVEKQKELVFNIMHKHLLDIHGEELKEANVSILKTEFEAWFAYDELLPENDLVPAMQEILENYYTKVGAAQKVASSPLETILRIYKSGQAAEAMQKKLPTWTPESLQEYLSKTPEIPLECATEQSAKNLIMAYTQSMDRLLNRFDSDQARLFKANPAALKEMLQGNKRMVERRFVTPLLKPLREFVNTISCVEGFLPEQQEAEKRLSDLYALQDKLVEIKETNMDDKLAVEELAKFLAESQPTFRSLREFSIEAHEGNIKLDEKLLESLDNQLQEFEAMYLPSFLEHLQQETATAYHITPALIDHETQNELKRLSMQCKRSSKGQETVMKKLKFRDMEPPSIVGAFIKSASEESQGSYALAFKEIQTKMQKSIAYLSNSEASIQRFKGAVTRISPSWKFFGFAQSERFEREYASIQPNILFLDSQYILPNRDLYWQVILKAIPQIKLYTKVVLVIEDGQQLKKDPALLELIATHIKQSITEDELLEKLIQL